MINAYRNSDTPGVGLEYQKAEGKGEGSVRGGGYNFLCISL